MLTQRTRHAGEISVVAEHDLFLDGIIELGSSAGGAEDHAQRVEGLGANLLGLEEVVTPGLLPQIHG